MHFPGTRRIAATIAASAVLAFAGTFMTAGSAFADAGTTSATSATSATSNTVTPAVSGSTIATIAKSQVHHGPCQSNSPYGGVGYFTSCNGEEWCADFAKWVWSTAGADVSGLTAAAGSFGRYGSGLHSTPHVGDAAVFGYNGNGYADHVVIVTAVSGNTFSDVGGNENNSVQADGPISATIGNTQFGLVLSGFVSPAGSGGGGSGANISSWTPGSSCKVNGNQFCLWYSPGQGTGGAGWGGHGSIGTISGTFSIGGSGQAGYGQAVRNNAGSMTNVTTNCNVTVWVSPNYTGDYNWLSPNKAGNLTSSLHNNEASISANNCT